MNLHSKNPGISADIITLVLCSTMIFMVLLGKRTLAGDFHINRISDRITVLTNQEIGEGQLFIESENGLIGFNSFWSRIPAELYKNEIVQIYENKKVNYLINMVNRLDMFGGNAAYPEATIVGHEQFRIDFKNEEEIQKEIDRLINMWRFKEKSSRERLATKEKGSKEALNEENWMNTCKRRADELEAGFSLVLPATYYKDRMSIDLGDITLNLIWFGKCGKYDGMSVVVIPEEKLAIIPGFILHGHHLAPYPYGEFTQLDVPRWIEILEEVLEGENAVERVICDINQVWSRGRAGTHLNYIRTLWESVRRMETEGRDLASIQEKFSLENDFSFVRDMQVYRDHGDKWVRPQHESHVRLFYLQHKNLASELIKNKGFDLVENSISELRTLREEGADVYFDEISLNALGYKLLRSGKLAEAEAVFELNVEVFPQSFNVFDSLAEACKERGNKALAIKHYKRSLELNPENNNAVRMLQELESN